MPFHLLAAQSDWYRERGSYCFSSGLTGGNLFQFCNFPENTCTNALRNAGGKRPRTTGQVAAATAPQNQNALIAP
jgi:hypothetical protein